MLAGPATWLGNRGSPGDVEGGSAIWSPRMEIQGGERRDIRAQTHTCTHTHTGTEVHAHAHAHVLYTHTHTHTTGFLNCTQLLQLLFSAYPFDLGAPPPLYRAPRQFQPPKWKLATCEKGLATSNLQSFLDYTQVSRPPPPSSMKS